MRKNQHFLQRSNNGLFFSSFFKTTEMSLSLFAKTANCLVAIDPHEFCADPRRQGKTLNPISSRMLATWASNESAKV